jgi:hypothetical protein
LKFVLGEEKTLVTSNIRVLPKSSGNDLREFSLGS